MAYRFFVHTISWRIIEKAITDAMDSRVENKRGYRMTSPFIDVLLGIPRKSFQMLRGTKVAPKINSSRVL